MKEKIYMRKRPQRSLPYYIAEQDEDSRSRPCRDICSPRILEDLPKKVDSKACTFAFFWRSISKNFPKYGERRVNSLMREHKWKEVMNKRKTQFYDQRKAGAKKEEL